VDVGPGAEQNREFDGGQNDLFRFIMNSAVEGLILLDGEYKVLDINEAAATMFGLPAGRLLGRSALDPDLDLIREDGSAIPEEERPSVAALRRGEAVRGMVIGVRKKAGSECLWAEVGAIPRPAGPGKDASFILVTLVDITEKKKARDKLSKRLRTLNSINEYSMRLADAPHKDVNSLIAGMGRNIFDASAVGIANYDAERKALILNEFSLSESIKWEGLKYLGDKFVRGLPAPVSNEEYRKMMELKVGVASNLHDFSFGKVPAAISSMIEKTLGIGWFRGLVLVSSGELFGGLGIAGAKDREAPEIDELRVFAEITANAIKRKQAEEKVQNLLAEKELLLHEVHHRIKNNMSTMISLLSLQSRTIKAQEGVEALKDAMGRLQSMNTLYDKLFRAEDLREMSLREYLPALVREIVDMFPNGEKVAVEAKVDDIKLGIKKLSILGILVNEIVANSMKYAFVGDGAGRIILSAKLKRDRVTLGVGDDGVGMPETVDLDHSTGFGLSLIRILAKQMDASVSIKRLGGTLYTIEFAVD
jgi:PAS domain S-box-containing protein